MLVARGPEELRQVGLGVSSPWTSRTTWRGRQGSETLERLTYSHQPWDQAPAASRPSRLASPLPGQRKTQILQYFNIEIFEYLIFRYQMSPITSPGLFWRVYPILAFTLLVFFITCKLHYMMILLTPQCKQHLFYSIITITTMTTAMMMVLTNDTDLAEDLVEVSLVRKERDYHEDREQEESHNCFPEINFVLGIKRIWLK